MADVCDLIEEVGSGLASKSDVTSGFTVERGAALDALSLAVVSVLTDTGVGTSVYVDRFASIVVEQGIGSSATQTALRAFSTISDKGIGSTALLALFRNTLSDTAVGTDSLTTLLSHTMVDSASASTTYVQTATAMSFVVDLAKAKDVVPPFMSSYVIESATAADVVVSTNRVLVLVSESAIGQAYASQSATYTQEVVNAAMGTSTYVDANQAIQLIPDEAFGFSEVHTPGGSAWTALAQTWGMSRYTNMPFNSLTAVNSVLVSANDEGIYTFNANNDAGIAINSLIDTGIFDVASSKLTRLRYAYLGYTSDGTLAIAMSGADDGAKETYTYPFPARPATFPVSNRTQLGRGLRSRYYKFSVQNQLGAGFRLHDVRIISDDSSRRV